MIATLVLGAVLGLIVGGGALAAWNRAFWLRHRTGRRAIVHTATEKSYDGLLTHHSLDGLVLKGATVVAAGKEVTMHGDTFIPADQVICVQMLG